MRSLVKNALWLCVLLATSCSTLASERSSLPYHAWALKFVAPNFMEVWVEAAEVQDVRGRFFPRAGGGTAAIGYSGSAAGWPQRLGASQGIDINGASLPKHIYVRWQSLVEPQTYRVALDIPEHVRELMLSQEAQPHYLPEQRMEYRNKLVIGLAPGGKVKLWVRGPGLNPVEVLCARAEIEPKGPYGGESGGKHRPLSDRVTPYLESHPVPYGSWDCGK